MTLENWLAFIVTAFIVTMTPGPSILIGVVNALKHGAKRTVLTALGDISANFIQMLLVSTGLGVIIVASEFAFHVIKWSGVIALAIMGIKMIFSKSIKIHIDENNANVSNKNLFISGFLVAAGNPKAIIFFTAFFPLFIDPSESLVIQLAVMCPTMAILDFTWVMIYALCAERFFGFIKNQPKLLNRIGGSALLGASIFLAFSRRTSTI